MLDAKVTPIPKRMQEAYQLHENHPLNLNDLLKKYPLSMTVDEFDKKIYEGVDVSRMTYLKTASDHKSDTAKVRILGKSIECMVWGGISGAGAGLIIGGVTGGLVGGPTLCLAGAGVGVLAGWSVGVAVGGSIGATIAYVKIVESKEYEEWKKLAISKEYFETYKAQLKNIFPNDMELMCPLTNEFPVFPLRSPNGQIYDASAIFAHLDRKEVEYNIFKKNVLDMNIPSTEKETHLKDWKKQNICPCGGKPFTKEQLIYDHLYVTIIREKLNSYLVQKMAKIETEFRQGIEAYIRAASQNHEKTTLQRTLIAVQKLREMGITDLDRQEVLIEEFLR